MYSLKFKKTFLQKNNQEKVAFKLGATFFDLIEVYQWIHTIAFNFFAYLVKIKSRQNRVAMLKFKLIRI
ncbi:hypothetical protein CMALT394_240007 [Carnobacterium maltaromaticum]|nr:hypothetical protein CMALT394_240007 [Carnobacterium maltaromaticum]